MTEDRGLEQDDNTTTCLPVDTSAKPSNSEVQACDVAQVLQTFRLFGGPCGVATAYRTIPRKGAANGSSIELIAGIGDDESPEALKNAESAIVQFAIKVNGRQALYATPNPVMYPLAGNRNLNRPYSGGKMTVDADIAARAFIYVDIDPVVADNNQPATDEECAAAAKVADDVTSFLRECSWGSPAARIHTGNGRALYYRTDLPNTPQSTDDIKRVLRVLAESCDSPGARVDLAVSNASRLMRVAGVVNCKGTCTDARPWRMAHFEAYETKAESGFVSLVQVQSVAAMTPSRLTSNEPVRNHDSDLEIIAVGHRNHVLFREACVFFRKGLHREQIVAILRDANTTRCVTPLDDAELMQIARSAQSATMSDEHGTKSAVFAGGLSVTNASKVRVERIEWLSANRIAFGGVTLFDGEGGVGKSTFIYGVIAAASMGVDFFTGEPIGRQRILIVGVEDGRGITVARLKRYGADLRSIEFVDAAHAGGRDVPLALPNHIDALEAKIKDLEITMVYIDALFSHIAMHGDGRMPQDVREALHPIGEMCKRTGVALTAVRHWTKSLGSASTRSMGSVEFTNFARATFTFGRHPDDDMRIVCSHTKSNYAQLTGAVSFRLDSQDVLDDNGAPWSISIATDLSAADGIVSDDLTMRKPCDPDDKYSAVEWLRDELADHEPHLTQEILAAANAANVGSRSTLNRAASSIGVKTNRTHDFPSLGTWTLPRPVLENIDSTSRPPEPVSSGAAQLTLQHSDSTAGETTVELLADRTSQSAQATVESSFLGTTDGRSEITEASEMVNPIGCSMLPAARNAVPLFIRVGAGPNMTAHAADGRFICHVVDGSLRPAKTRKSKRSI